MASFLVISEIAIRLITSTKKAGKKESRIDSTDERGGRKIIEINKMTRMTVPAICQDLLVF